MTTTATLPDHRLPFGAHKGLPLSEVPTNYLGWLLAAPGVHLGSGLRAAVRAELLARPDRPAQVPAEPEARPTPPCRCGGTEVRLSWQALKDGRRAIRRECAACHHWLVGFAPMTPANVALADAVEAATRKPRRRGKRRRKRVLSPAAS